MCQYANKRKAYISPPIDTFFIGILARLYISLLAHWHISILTNYLYYDKD